MKKILTLVCFAMLPLSAAFAGFFVPSFSACRNSAFPHNPIFVQQSSVQAAAVPITFGYQPDALMYLKQGAQVNNGFCYKPFASLLTNNSPKFKFALKEDPSLISGPTSYSYKMPLSFSSGSSIYLGFNMDVRAGGKDVIKLKKGFSQSATTSGNFEKPLF